MFLLFCIHLIKAVDKLQRGLKSRCGGLLPHEAPTCHCPSGALDLSPMQIIMHITPYSYFLNPKIIQSSGNH